ncbi:MAG TPA: alcohol dehydrogenase catalytic domain-containing protein [Jatrophihabitantaceae bacterium]|jgi:threonine dehydrogenase-like Zn-dependent dehydrogenase
MRAFVVAAPGSATVEDVEPPAAVPGEVVVDVERVGICGTDHEFLTGDMAYLRSGHARYPMRIGHEWCGVVSAVGDGVDATWLGQRVTGDTMLGCGACATCAAGRRYLCPNRLEIGIRGGRPGALAEQLAVPVTALHALPPTVGPTAGALVEPGGNSIRAAQAAGAAPGVSIAIWGPGTIGLLAALFARAAGAEVHVVGLTDESLAFARSLGLRGAADAPTASFDAAIDATNGASAPDEALRALRPGGRLVCIGIAAEPSRIDTRDLVFGDTTVLGLLSGSPVLPAAIDNYATGAVDPTPLVAATVGLDQVADALAGERPDGAGPGPKVHVDPRL